MKLSTILENYMVNLSNTTQAQIPTTPTYYRQFEYDLLRNIRNGKDVDYEGMSYNDKIRVENLIQRNILTDKMTMTSVGFDYLKQLEVTTAPTTCMPFANISFR